MIDIPEEFRNSARAILVSANIDPMFHAELIFAIARALLTERTRCLDHVCFPAAWHLKNDQSSSELIADIRRRIMGEDA